MRLRTIHISLLIVLLLFAACSSTKYLQKNEYLLTRNTVKVTDVKSDDFSNFPYILRPEPNKKFLGLNLKVWAYLHHQAETDSVSGKVKDTKLKKWFRETVGEPPVLLDSSQIETSMEQLRIALKKLGYFSPDIHAEVHFKKSNPQKVQVHYLVTAHETFYVRDIYYHINIPEFRKIVILDTTNSLLKKGMQYNEITMNQEINRIANLIRNKGYFYANSSLITIEVDTLYSQKYRNKEGNQTLTLDIQIDFNNVKIKQEAEKMLYQYDFDKIFIYTDYKLEEYDNQIDTVIYNLSGKKKDSTDYYFITFTPKETKKNAKKIYKDFRYNTLTNIIYTKKGEYYNANASARSYSRIQALENFNIINIDFLEDLEKRDTLRKKGSLNVRYQLTRSKLNSLRTEIELNSRKSNLSVTYTNKNIFKGAEFLSIGFYGGVNIYLYTDYRKSREAADENNSGVGFPLYVGGVISLNFPRLFPFKMTQSIDALRYSTIIHAGINYNLYFKRWRVNAALTYNWQPNYNVHHIFSPLSIITIDPTVTTYRSLTNYPLEYRKKFDKKMITSVNYILNYVAPIKNRNHLFRFSLDLKSAGWIPLLLDQFSKKEMQIMGYPYCVYLSAEFNLRYSYTINKKNSVATRLNLGMVDPIYHRKEAVIPFESSFYMGGASSMRGWSYLGLGPGSYTQNSYIERAGDIKIEMNFEYRGTIYRFFKYGLFIDIGNIWLSRDYVASVDDDSGVLQYMNGVKFTKNFIKDLAMDVGAGLRLDFGYFLIRLDYGLPIYDPTAPSNKWLNKHWRDKIEGTDYRHWRFFQGFKLAIDHAF
jgi:hypothetical protein